MANEYMHRWEKMWRSPEENRRSFLETVKKGDILISKSGVLIGVIGHAAIMVSDYWVLEMSGGAGQGGSSFLSSFSSSPQNLDDNNRRISKYNWYDEHKSDSSIMVYRCCDNSIAIMAAAWAYTHYYNPSGGDEKTIQIRYSVNSPDFEARDPSYCSKLVLQAYYYGTGSADVISDARLLLLRYFSGKTIVPTDIPAYFTLPYRLDVIGMY